MHIGNLNICIGEKNKNPPSETIKENTLIKKTALRLTVQGGYANTQSVQNNTVDIVTKV